MAKDKTYKDASLLLDIIPIPDKLTGGTVEVPTGWLETASGIDYNNLPFGPRFPAGTILDQATLESAVIDEYYNLTDIYDQAINELEREIKKEPNQEMITITQDDEYDGWPLNRKGINTLPCGSRPPYVQGLIPAIYNTYFGRQPELAGLLFWTNRAIELGIRIELFRNSLTRENYSYFQGFIPALYNQLLGRQPELEGLNFWNDYCTTLGISLEVISRTNQTSDSWAAQQVRTLCTEMLNSTLDSTGAALKPNADVGGAYRDAIAAHPGNLRAAITSTVELIVSEFIAREPGSWIVEASAADSLIASSVPLYANYVYPEPPSISDIANYSSLYSNTAAMTGGNQQITIPWNSNIANCGKGNAIVSGIVSGNYTAAFKLDSTLNVALSHTPKIGWDLGYGYVSASSGFTIVQHSSTNISPLIYEYSADSVTWNSVNLAGATITTSAPDSNGFITTTVALASNTPSARAFRIGGTQTGTWRLSGVRINIVNSFTVTESQVNLYELVDRSTGTLIGNLTAGGGLNVTFDGTPSTIASIWNEASNSAENGHSRSPSLLTSYGTIGKHWSRPKTISGFKVWSSGSGWDGTSQAATITLLLQGSNDTTDGNDGTWTTLYSSNFSDVWGSQNIQEVYAANGVIDTSTAYIAHRIYITGSSLDSGGQVFQCNGLDFYEKDMLSPTVTIAPNSPCVNGAKGDKVNCINTWNIGDAIHTLCYEMAMTQYNSIEQTYIESPDLGGELSKIKGKYNDPLRELTEMSETVAHALINKTTNYAKIAAKANGLGSSSVPLYCGHLTSEFNYPGNWSKFPGGQDEETKPGNRVNCEIPCEEYIQGMIPAIYNIAFGRQPEAGGLEYWYNIATGMGITQEAFVNSANSPETAQLIHDLLYLMIKTDAVNFIPAKSSSYPEFLNQHGIWEFNREQASFDHTFVVNFPTTGAYEFTGTADNNFTIIVDGTTVLTGTNLTTVYNSIQAGITAGNHNIRIIANNTGGPGSIGLTIAGATAAAQQYSRVTFPLWPQFLNDHGIWNLDLGALNFDHYVDVNFPTSGNYTFTGTADNEFAYYLDDVQVLTANNWRNIYSNTVAVTAGVHRIRLTSVNLGGPAGLACTITDGSGSTIFATEQLVNLFEENNVGIIFDTVDLLNVFGPGFENGGMLQILLKTYSPGVAATMTANMIIDALVNKTSRWAIKAAEAPNLKATSIALHPGDLNTTTPGTIGEQINGQSCGQCSHYIQSLIPYLYNEIYGRQPEPEGLYFWAKYCYDNGITIERYSGNLNEDTEMAGKLQTLVTLMVSGQEAHYDPQSGCGIGGLIGERLAAGDTPQQAAAYTISEVMRTLKAKDREGAVWAAAIHSYVGKNTEGAVPLLFPNDTTDTTHTWTTSIPLYLGNLIDHPGGQRGAQVHGADEGYMCKCDLPDVEMLAASFASYNSGPNAVSLGRPDEEGVRFGLFQWAFTEETRNHPDNQPNPLNVGELWKYVTAAEQLGSGGKIGLLEQYIEEKLRGILPNVDLTVPVLAEKWKKLEDEIADREWQVKVQEQRARDILTIAQRTIAAFENFDLDNIPRSIMATAMSIFNSVNNSYGNCIPMMYNAYRSASPEALTDPSSFVTNLFQEKNILTKYVTPSVFEKLQNYNGMQINMAKANLREQALALEMAGRESNTPYTRLVDMDRADLIAMRPLKDFDRYVFDRMAEINEGIGGYPLSRIQLTDELGNAIPRYNITPKAFEDPDLKYPLRNTNGEIKFPGEPEYDRLSRGVTAETPIEKREVRAISVPGAEGSWNEPQPGYNAKYPNNNVVVTKSGITIEIDDTPGFERVNIYHPSHTYIEIDQEGNLKIRNAKDRFEICDRDHKTYVRNNLDETVGGFKTKYIQSDSVEKVDGNVTITTGGNDTQTIGGTKKINAGMILLNC